MSTIRSIFIFWGWLCLVSNSFAQQQPVQTISGTVSDQSIKTLLTGATIELDAPSGKKTIADASGNFRFEHIPVGRHSLTISYIGYKTVTLHHLLVESGKQLVQLVEMEEEVMTGKEVIVKSKPNKSRALNEFSLVSSRMFSVEETRRIAAAINDPSRIATAFAGVSGSGDGNALIIRGNAPNGLLWRMEGVDVPNPNHFASVGTSGGGISILSAQLLANSDFLSGAFPAEYGNALSGVFDIRLRKGNKEKREHTFSVSTIGIDAASEGYFKKGYAGSYLINYRYGFLTLMQKLGLNIGDAATSFQDLSFNVFLPTKKIGDFSIFGFGGKSKQETIPVSDSITWTNSPSQRSGYTDGGNTGAVGITHSLHLDKKTFLKTVISLNGYRYINQNSNYAKINGPLIVTRDNQFTESDAVISMLATHKFNSHHLFKIGLIQTHKSFDLQQKETVSNLLRDKVKSTGNTWLTNGFVEWKWDPIKQLSIQTGLHAQHFALNQSSDLEPRLGLRYRTGPGQFLTFGLGWHAQIQPLGNYFARIKVGTDSLQPNMGLDFSKARHYVLGYSIQLSPDWNLKAEAYYQWLYNIPVTATGASSYSLINQEDDYAITPLANKGNGKNYGLEITLERYWNDRFYCLSTLSLYESKYLASDMIWRNTKYNSNAMATLATGKEWTLKGKRNSTFSLDLKMLYNGGVRVTPIDLVKSIAQKTTVLDNNRIYEDKLKQIYRIDLQAEWKFQYNKRTGSFIAGVQNLTDQQNPVRQSFDSNTGKIKYSYLLGITPVIGYKLDF